MKEILWRSWQNANIKRRQLLEAIPGSPAAFRGFLLLFSPGFD
jgi:hypothetical protein